MGYHSRKKGPLSQQEKWATITAGKIGSLSQQGKGATITAVDRGHYHSREKGPLSQQ